MSLKINPKFNSGMTLTEVTIATFIISILILVGLVSLRSQVFKGDDARKKAETRRIGIAAEEYEKDHNCYPLPHQVACNPGTGLQPYMDKIPCDPDTRASYYYEHEDSDCPGWYKIYSNLLNTNDTDYMSEIGPGGSYSFVYSSSNAPAEAGHGGGSVQPPANYYGCIGGACTPISWDPDRPGPECDPNFQNSTCYGACSQPSSACQSWTQ